MKVFSVNYTIINVLSIKCGFSVRMVMMLVLACAGYILVGASETTWVAIAGVVCTAFASGLGEATLLSYMSFFTNKYVKIF